MYMKPSLFDSLITLLHLRPDQAYTILDIGCGTGELLRTISERVAGNSRLVGIDPMGASIASAQTQHPDGEYLHQKFERQLTFGDGEFDLVLSVDVLECVIDKAALLREMARVLKPHGTVLCAHWDWDTQVYASEQPHRLRPLIHAFADWQQGWMDACDGMMGRKLWGIFQGSHLFTGHMEVYTHLETEFEPGHYGYDRLHDLAALVRRGTVSAADYEQIGQEMQQLSSRGEYFYSLNSYIYRGKKRSPA
jgi:SAM-dependent methyltransferase